jgi:hypothetical protein
MIRMMLHENATGDQHFKEMMQDLANAIAVRPPPPRISRPWFKKHMTKVMDVAGNHKMDWFFNECVYGTQLPSYKFDFSFDNSPEGDVIFNFNVTQSNVDKDFRMIVPLYLELADGKIVFLGRVPIYGNTAVPGKVPLQGFQG